MTSRGSLLPTLVVIFILCLLLLIRNKELLTSSNTEEEEESAKYAAFHRRYNITLLEYSVGQQKHQGAPQQNKKLQQKLTQQEQWKDLCNVNCQKRVPCEYKDEVDFRIISLASTRADSLRKSLDHVSNIVFDNATGV